MGGHSSSRQHAPWTFVLLVVVVLVVRAECGLFQDLGLNALPDVTKINISQDEYTRMMGLYLESRRRSSTAPNSIPELITFYLEENWWRLRADVTRLKFDVGRSGEGMEVDGAQLRFLAPAASSPVRVQLHQVVGPHRRRLLDEKTLYLSPAAPKWCELDASAAAQSWLDGERNVGVEITCVGCAGALRPAQAAISVLVYPGHERLRRNASPYQPLRRTDCRESRRTGVRRRCCRHNMTVKFAELRFPEMGSIVQPKSYEAGFCQGQCPPNYNHATNHSRIQSLLHQMDRKSAKRLNRRAIPKACCAPSKLEPLEILRVNPTDATKLIVEKWDNMQVVECACS